MTGLSPAPLLVTRKTRVMFILGDPISHVIGTSVLNTAWTRLGLDLVTVPLHVRPPDLSATLDLIRRTRNVAGSGITIPHKVAVVPLLDHLTEAARLTGAVNFLRRNDDGTLTGHNVDGAGFLAGLQAQGIDPAGNRVALAGAGGVARAIAFAIAGAGAASLTIRNRDTAKADALAAAISAWPGANGCTVRSGDDPKATLRINGTSLGMRDGDPLPFPDSGGEVAAEVVMTPALTPFLKAAQQAGARTVPGRAMMDPQAGLVARFLEGDPA